LAKLHELSERLLEAERGRSPIAPLTDEWPDLSMEEAYEVQRLGIEARAEEPVGYKLGFTSEAMRNQMGIPSPNHGVLTERMISGREVDLSSLIHPRVEPEVAVRTKEDLSGPDASAEEVRRAVEWVYPAIEVVDSRFAKYRFLLPDNTADNSSAARFVLGEPVSPDDFPDLRSVAVSLRKDGEEIDSGLGSNAMGDPFAAVAWLVNALHERGNVLAAGSVVLTGGLTKAHPVGEGGIFAAEFDGFGRVEARFS
jgi:2-keto-4-pentenoate hydratase